MIFHEKTFEEFFEAKCTVPLWENFLGEWG